MEVGAGLLDFMRETGFGGCPLTPPVSVLLFCYFNIKSVISLHDTTTFLNLLNSMQPYLLFDSFNEEEGDSEDNLHLHLKYVIFRFSIVLSKYL